MDPNTVEVSERAFDQASPVSSTAPVIQGCSPGYAITVRLTCLKPQTGHIIGFQAPGKKEEKKLGWALSRAKHRAQVQPN